MKPKTDCCWHRPFLLILSTFGSFASFFFKGKFSYSMSILNVYSICLSKFFIVFFLHQFQSNLSMIKKTYQRQYKNKRKKKTKFKPKNAYVCFSKKSTFRWTLLCHIANIILNCFLFIAWSVHFGSHFRSCLHSVRGSLIMSKWKHLKKKVQKTVRNVWNVQT